MFQEGDVVFAKHERYVDLWPAKILKLNCKTSNAKVQYLPTGYDFRFGSVSLANCEPFNEETNKKVLKLHKGRMAYLRALEEIAKIQNKEMNLSSNEVCEFFDMKNVQLRFSGANYRNITTYELFDEIFRSKIQDANPEKNPDCPYDHQQFTKVVKAHWEEFQVKAYSEETDSSDSDEDDLKTKVISLQKETESLKCQLKILNDSHQDLKKFVMSQNQNNLQIKHEIPSTKNTENQSVVRFRTGKIKGIDFDFLSHMRNNRQIKQNIPSFNENPANQSFTSAENVKKKL